MIFMENSYHKYSCRLDQINKKVLENPVEFIQKMENSYRQNIKEIAQELLQQKNICKVVMLAGPSGSGKTTTAHFLRQQLKELGAGATIISLDDFYLGRSQAPLLEDGSPDYEAVEALNLEEIHHCLLGLLQKGYCEKPSFDFITGRPSDFRTKVQLGVHDVAIVEGIHALNPAITQGLPLEGLTKVYLSVKQGINNEKEKVLSAQDLRFIRRLVRDYNYRGVPPMEMLEMWGTVCRGERLYIQPFKHTSNYTINSIHLYEPCVLQHIAVPLLKQIPPEHQQFPFAFHLLDSLNRFKPIPMALVPANSLLREFIGSAGE